MTTSAYPQIAMTNVPQTISNSPTVAFLLSFSWNTMYEKPTETKMLILSIGTTTLTIPF